MSYDVQFIRVPVPAKTTFPVEADRAKGLLKKAQPIGDPKAVRTGLLALEGCRAGSDKAVDFMGKGLSYARLFVKAEGVHVENNCGPRDLLKMYREIRDMCPDLLILDLQSGQLHDADSFQKWWSRPL